MCSRGCQGYCVQRRFFEAPGAVFGLLRHWQACFDAVGVWRFRQNIKGDIEDAVDEIKEEFEAQGLQFDKRDMSKLTTLITDASKEVFPLPTKR